MSNDQFREFLREVLPSMGYSWRRFERRNIRRRVRSRMESLQIHEMARYARLVIADAGERAVLDSLLRLTITRFFRNSWLWSELAELISEAAVRLESGETLNIWSAGCAGGEEPFSLAMLMDDLARSGILKRSWTILATDTDRASLERAHTGTYRWGSVREVPRHLLHRWFSEDDGVWSLSGEVRDLVTFREHDILTMEPPGRFHLVFLRNSVLTYNVEEVQRRALESVRSCLVTPGYLIIGRTEKMPEGVGFEEVEKCIYRKRE